MSEVLSSEVAAGRSVAVDGVVGSAGMFGDCISCLFFVFLSLLCAFLATFMKCKRSSNDLSQILQERRPEICFLCVQRCTGYIQYALGF